MFTVSKFNKTDFTVESETFVDFDDAYDTFCQYTFEVREETGEDVLIHSSLDNEYERYADFDDYKITLKMTKKE